MHYLTRRQHEVLRTLQKLGHPTLQEWAQAQGITAASFRHNLLNRLRTAGLIQHNGQRCRPYSITLRGRKHLAVYDKAEELLSMSETVTSANSEAVASFRCGKCGKNTNTVYASRATPRGLCLKCHIEEVTE